MKQLTLATAGFVGPGRSRPTRETAARLPRASEGAGVNAIGPASGVDTGRLVARCLDQRLPGHLGTFVAEMDRVAIPCDLSHVGAVTSRDVIVTSKRPTAYTHILPAALKVPSAQQILIRKSVSLSNTAGLSG
jgi:hypothetical protein